MKKPSSRLIASVSVVAAIIVVAITFRPRPTLIDDSKNRMSAVLAGDASVIANSPPDTDLAKCQLTRSQWRKIAEEVISPAFRHWRIKSRVTEILANKDTLAVADYILIDREGRSAEAAIPAFTTGEASVTPVQHWMLIFSYLEGLRRLPVSHTETDRMKIMGIGLKANLPRLTALGFTGFMTEQGQDFRYVRR